jgi:3-deoxy-D-manno-octulosonate 8-phosphate phosphatase (KDO 8-P phosphatase)
MDNARLTSIELVVFDFDGVFTDNTVFVSEQGTETVRCWRSDGLGLARLRAAGVEPFIVSTETNPVVSARAGKLKVDCIQGVADKAECVAQLCSKKGVALENVAFVGNDINDIPAFKVAGLSVAVADAYPEVLPHVDHRLTKAGGFGAVRELCDMIWHARSSSVLGGQEGGNG